jgi:hypothetical protein
MDNDETYDKFVLPQTANFERNTYLKEIVLTLKYVNTDNFFLSICN